MWNGQTLFRVIRIHPQCVCVCKCVSNIGSLKYFEVLSVAENASRWADVTSMCCFVCVCQGDLCLLIEHMSHPDTCLLLNCFGLPRLLWGVCLLPKRLTATGMWRTMSLCSQQTIIYPFFPPVSSNWFRSLLPFLVMWKVYNIMCVCVYWMVRECNSNYFCPLGPINTPQLDRLIDRRMDW